LGGRAGESGAEMPLLTVILGGEAQSLVEVRRLRTPAVAPSIGPHGGIKLEPGPRRWRAQRVGDDVLFLGAGAAGDAQLQAAQGRPYALPVQRADGHAAVDVFEFVRVEVAVDLAVGDGNCVFELVAEQLL